MEADAKELQDAYAAALVAWLRSEQQYKPTWEPGYLTVVRWYWEGEPPNSELRVLFRVADRPCLYGMVDRAWDEGALDVPLHEVERVVSDTSLRWLEGLETGELPHRCRPDSAGVTWLQLWEDW